MYQRPNVEHSCYDLGDFKSGVATSDQSELRSSRETGVSGCFSMADFEYLWFAKTLSDFEINDLAAAPALFCYNS
jgi:hypothetical protein